MGKKSKRAKALLASADKSPDARRRFLFGSVAALGLVFTAVGINAYDQQHRELHDLSVIGGGAPVIVQIHDPGCPTCRRLKNIVSNALAANDPVLYRLADITTAQGRELQARYNVPNVTLLYFDQHGRRVHTTQGLLSASELRNHVMRLFSEIAAVERAAS